MQKRLLFKIGYVCKIPWGGGGEGMTIWPTVYQEICQMSFGIGLGIAEVQILKKVKPALSLETFWIFW